MREKYFIISLNWTDVEGSSEEEWGSPPLTEPLWLHALLGGSFLTPRVAGLANDSVLFSFHAESQKNNECIFSINNIPYNIRAKKSFIYLPFNFTWNVVLFFSDNLAQSWRFQLLKIDKILEEDGKCFGECWGTQERDLGVDMMKMHCLYVKILK